MRSCAFLSLAACTFLLPVAAYGQNTNCEVTPAQRDAARQLDWQVFDQDGGLPATFRDLSKKGCNAEALSAYRDWLEHGTGFSNPRERAIGTFHIAQMLAFLGDRETAVQFFNNAFRPDSDEAANAVEWNIYVRGTLAYFAQDRDALTGVIEELGSLNTSGASRWQDRLEGLRRCLRKTYREAMSPACQRR